MFLTFIKILFEVFLENKKDLELKIIKFEFNLFIKYFFENLRNKIKEKIIIIKVKLNLISLMLNKMNSNLIF